jgi:hypothetical protein
MVELVSDLLELLNFKLQQMLKDIRLLDILIALGKFTALF